MWGLRPHIHQNSAFSRIDLSRYKYNNPMPLKRILIIDDARDVGRMHQQALRTLYPRVPVTFVPSPEEALVEVTTFTVDVMVVDIRLPGMSGIDLVRRVRLRQPDIKVIMITGMYLDEAIEAAEPRGGRSAPAEQAGEACPSSWRGAGNARRRCDRVDGRRLAPVRRRRENRPAQPPTRSTTPTAGGNRAG